jgi:predicted ATPase
MTRTIEALIRQLEGLARQQPVVMVFEDAHWIDPTSRELLDQGSSRSDVATDPPRPRLRPSYFTSPIAAPNSRAR